MRHLATHSMQAVIAWSPGLEPLLWPFLCETAASYIIGATEGKIQNPPGPSAAHSPAALNTNQVPPDTS